MFLHSSHVSEYLCGAKSDVLVFQKQIEEDLQTILDWNRVIRVSYSCLS